MKEKKTEEAVREQQRKWEKDGQSNQLHRWKLCKHTSNA
jgi:hypothetical protein